MDRMTYEQIDRMEAKLDNLTAGVAELLSGEAIISGINLIESEIYSTEGKLQHLKEDKKVIDFLESLKSDLSEDIEDDEEENSRIEKQIDMNLSDRKEEKKVDEKKLTEIHNKPKEIKSIGIDDDEYYSLLHHLQYLQINLI